MYDRVFDEQSVASELVDVLRAKTDAPLEECRETAVEIVGILAGYNGEDILPRVALALSKEHFVLDEENCYDAQLLRILSGRLKDWFAEKSELSYSIGDNDSEHVDALRLFASIALKTDKRIPQRIVEEDNYDFAHRLSMLYLMDQSLPIRSSALCALSSLCTVSPSVASFLIESKLPTTIADQLPSSPQSMKSIDWETIDLLDTLFRSGIAPPLDHFCVFDRSFVSRLLSLVPLRETVCLSLLSHFHAVSPPDHQNVILEALSEHFDSSFGHLLIEFVNKHFSASSSALLLFLLSQSESLVHKWFYSNDLHVLVRILCRELLDNENVTLRQMCLSLLYSLLSVNISDSLIEETVRDCRVNDNDLKEKVMRMIEEKSL